MSPKLKKKQARRRAIASASMPFKARTATAQSAARLGAISAAVKGALLPGQATV